MTGRDASKECARTRSLIRTRLTLTEPDNRHPHGSLTSLILIANDFSTLDADEPESVVPDAVFKNCSPRSRSARGLRAATGDLDRVVIEERSPLPGPASRGSRPA